MMAAPRKAPGAARWEALASQWVKHLGEFKTARTAKDVMAQGTHLLMLKEASFHGEWRNHVNRLGLSAHAASKLMAVARRFVDAPDAFFDAIGGASKLTELLPLPDPDTGTLAHGGEVHGLTLEGIKPMTVLQLRKAVRLLLGIKNMAALRVALEPIAQATPVRLSVDEERMLRLFRKCSAPAREALFGVAQQMAARECSIHNLRSNKENPCQ